ncbi:MAG: ArsA-related P-loop ATPase [Actinomycetota bacterium]
MLDRRLLLVSGKGGVGKSAIAAALATLAARQGKRVLALAMTEQTGLAAHLGVDALPYQPARIRPGLFGAAIDRSNALDEYLKLQLRVPSAMPTGQLSRALSVLVDTAPGVREIITMGKPIYEVWREEWDLIVADAPPLGQLQSYLDAPNTITGLVPTGAVREQAGRLAKTLSDPRTSALLLVTTPEELAIHETREATAEIDERRQVLIAGVWANRVLDPLPVDHDAITALPDGPARSAGLLHSGLAAAQGPWLDAIPSDPRIPLLFGLRTPAEVSAQLADLCERCV